MKIVLPGEFDSANHWYQKVLNSSIHPLIEFFFNLGSTRIINRYCHLHPLVSAEYLQEILRYRSKYFLWSGTDLINVTSAGAKKQMVVIETNSCPSGQKSMPLLNDYQEFGGYIRMIKEAFVPYVKTKKLIQGVLAVIYDKNEMEASGYAAAMAEIFQEPVYYIPFYNGDADKQLIHRDKQLWVLVDGDYIPVRAAFRYLTQKPWNRLPISSKTIIFNPIIACLAGGRNKLVASKAYEFYNAELEGSGLRLNLPETIWDVNKNEIPLWINKFGGQAVIKVPYSNAGQGVYTITSQQELDEFMNEDFEYEQFIVQSLIGNYQWSSHTEKGKLYHVGTMPDKKGLTYVADLRFMICSGKDGFKPQAIYARRAQKPLANRLEDVNNSWEILGTNLSKKLTDNQWESDTSRLVLVDRKDFNRLGLGLDDLIEAYIQTILATIAIDKMAQRLINSKGTLKKKLFRSLNNDRTFLEEILN